jgi:hypothetical protein
MSNNQDNAVPEMTSDTRYYAIVRPNGEFWSTKTHVSEGDAWSFLDDYLKIDAAQRGQYRVIPVWVTIRDAR